MSKRLLSLVIITAMLSAFFSFGTACVFAESLSEAEGFDSYASDWSLTAVNKTTVSSGKWSVADSGNGVGTDAIAAKDVLSIGTETDSDTQQSNAFGRITRSWPAAAVSSDKMSNIYFKRSFENAHTGKVTASMQLRLHGLTAGGINIYLYDSEGSMILRCLAVGGKITFFKYTQASPSSSVSIGYFETNPVQDNWAKFDITVNTFSGEISVSAGDGFKTQLTRTITDSSTAVPVKDVAVIGYSIERFANNGSGYLDLDNLALSSESFSVADDFTFDQISDEEQGNVTQNLRLPQSYTAADGITYDVSWNSSDRTALTESGNVTRSAYDKIVCLTASFSLNGTQTASRNFYVNISAEGAYHFKDFFNGNAGTAITAYNSWIMDNPNVTGQSAMLADSPTESGNTVMVINRTKKNSVQRVKRFFNSDGTALNKTVFLSASVYRKNDVQPFYITVRNASTEGNIIAQIQIGVDGSASYWALDSSGTAKRFTLTSSKDKYIPYGEWCNVSVCLGYSDNSFILYVNGKPSDAAGIFYSKNTKGLTTVGAGGIEFDIERNTTPEDAVINDLLYVDNVNVRTLSGAFAVENVYISDKNGVSVKDLQNGGKIEGASLRLQKTLTENTQLLAALYDSAGVLVSARAEMLVPSEISSDTHTMHVDMELPESGDLSGYSFRIYAWNPLTLKPVMDAYTYNSSAAPIVIYVAGDSIGANYSESYYPQCGYGQVLGKFFDSSHVVVDNRAAGGRTTLSFITEGRLDSILSSITNGDYLFIQFGHNDQTKQNEVGTGTKVDANATAESTEYAEGTYQYYLMQYVEKAKAAGANPVLVTPPYRRAFDNGDGILLNSALTPYVEAMRKFAEAQNVPLIDLNAGWTQHFIDNNITNAELAKNYYMIIDKDDPRFADDESRITINLARATGVCLTPTALT